MTTTQDLPQHELSAQLLTESHDRFDQTLARWFAQHQGGGWSGTASELIAALKVGADVGNNLWSQPARALYAHLDSHRGSLHDLGVDVLRHPGFPKLVCLRACREGRPSEQMPPVGLQTNRLSDPTGDHHSPVEQESAHDVSDVVSPVEHDTASPALGFAEPVEAERVHDYKDAARSSSHAFEDTAQALFGIVEMRDRIREQSLDLKSTMHLVASRTQAITGSSGVVLGWLKQGTLVYPARCGMAAEMAGLPCQADLLRSCIGKGMVLQLPDAQRDPVVGASCRRESVRSLIVAPIFQNRKVAGAMELLFNETRSFSIGDVMTLELIADLVSEQLDEVENKSDTQPTPEESNVWLRITEDIDPLYDKSDEDGRAGYPQSAGPTLEQCASAEATIPMTIPVSASVSRKRVWTRLP